MSKSILLGYAVPTGKPVHVRRHHTVVTGSTQLSGKSTTLEALATRACRDDPRTTVIAFVTKRGEGAMTGARPHQAYFRDRADWQYVQAILEATMRERLKFQRSWIIKASHGAKTLQDVRANVVKALADPKTRGISESVYTELKAFLDVVIPQLEAHPFATRLTLAPGLNVMDLTRLTQEVQALVIASTIEALHRDASNTIVLVPEAWKFLPEGRKGPVQLAAEAYAREGATLGNYLWLDSQDIAGVDKAPLKMVDVWVLGRQREKNEVERTIAQLPTGRAQRPSVEQVMRLPVGHFYACTEEDGVTLTYVQPAWMPTTSAIAVAQGKLTVDDVRNDRIIDKPREVEDPMWKEKYEQERAKRLELEKEVERLSKKADQVDAEVKAAIRAHKANPTASSATAPALPSATGREPGVVLQLQVDRPSIELRVDRPVVKADDSTIQGRLALLVFDGFFDQPRKAIEIYAEARARGWGEWNSGGNNATMYKQMGWLCEKAFVRKEGQAWQAIVSAKERVLAEEAP